MSATLTYTCWCFVKVAVNLESTPSRWKERSSYGARSNNLGQAAVAWALGAWLAGSKVRFPVRAAGGADGLV
jgi:hypothetical protein